MFVVIINVLYTNTHVEGYLSLIGSTESQMEMSEWCCRAEGGGEDTVMQGCGDEDISMCL